MNALFLDRMLVLMSQGGFTATYKYALLLSLIDHCVEGEADGALPTMMTTRQVARRLVELYWPHTRVYTHDADPRVLFQSSTASRQRVRTQATVLTRIADVQGRYEERHRRAPWSPGQVEREEGELFATLLDQVEWTAVREPIPRLQLIGDRVEPFIYQIGWTVEQNSGRPIQPHLPVVSRRWLRQPDFDNRLLFLDGVPEQLLTLSAVLRPLIQRCWSDRVAQLNDLPERFLDEFLFGSARQSLEPIRRPLLELQGGCCFYCARRVATSDAHVDHVLPRSRVPLDCLSNLVVADRICNESKLDFLVGHEHVTRWATRDRVGLEQIARETTWDLDFDRTRSAARVVYRHLLPGMPLWRGRNEFRDLNSSEREEILRCLERPSRPA